MTLHLHLPEAVAKIYPAFHVPLPFLFCLIIPVTPLSHELMHLCFVLFLHQASAPEGRSQEFFALYPYSERGAEALLWWRTWVRNECWHGRVDKWVDYFLHFESS